MKYVIDASIILTALLESNPNILDKVKHKLLLIENGDYEAVSPDFLKIEVANGLRYNLDNSSKATDFFNGFLMLPISFLDLSRSIYEEAIHYAFKYKTTVYDTLYHILAKSQNATFLTCDQEYYKKAKDLGDIELIK